MLACRTMFLLAGLYMEMKARLIKQGQWFDASGHRRRVTQYHEVITLQFITIFTYVWF
jgi:hypothetical protein